MIDRAIEVLGMCRSGHHGIIVWADNSFANMALRYNNVNMNGVSIEDNDGKCLKDIEQTSKTSNVPCLLFNREDFSLNGIIKRKKLRLLENVPTKTVIVIRDPYNWAASRLVLARKQETAWLKISKDVISRYKTYLLQALGIKNYFNEEPVVVNYNKWFSDETYREHLVSVLNLPKIPVLDDCIVHYTSFNDVGKTSCLNVNCRWTKFVADKEYLRIFKDSELVELSRLYFGRLYVKSVEEKLKKAQKYTVRINVPTYKIQKSFGLREVKGRNCEKRRAYAKS
jgi:hypothetical protein